MFVDLKLCHLNSIIMVGYSNIVTLIMYQTDFLVPNTTSNFGAKHAPTMTVRDL